MQSWGSFDSQKAFAQSKLWYTASFSQIFYTEKPLQREVSMHSKLWHKKAPTQKSIYTQKAFTQKLSHIEALTLYTAFTHTASLYTQQASAQRSFYTQKPLHTEAFTHSKLSHAEAFAHSKLLHREAPSQRSIYTEKLFTHRGFYGFTSFTHGKL